MLPNAKAIKKLLYVSDGRSGWVYVYNYATGSLVGKLGGLHKPADACVDADGDVWFTSEPGSVVEYAHGGTRPLKNLPTATEPVGCSVSANGDLAVSTAVGVLEVWKHAAGKPAKYEASGCAEMLGPGYDNDGNLYVEAVLTGSDVRVCELPARGTLLKNVDFYALKYFGSPIWDGRYMTLTDTGTGDSQYLRTTTIYQVVQKAHGFGIKIVGKTVLTDSCKNSNVVYAPFIVGEKNTPVNPSQGHTVIGANAFCSGEVAFWPYPGGGALRKTLQSAPDKPSGAVVSIAR